MGILDRHLRQIPWAGTMGSCLRRVSQVGNSNGYPRQVSRATSQAGISERHLGRILRAGTIGRCFRWTSMAGTSGGCFGKILQRILWAGILGGCLGWVSPAGNSRGHPRRAFQVGIPDTYFGKASRIDTTGGDHGWMPWAGI